MKNLIVVGDSFCASPGWPQELARLLDLNLIVAGFPGQHWWSYRHFLDQTLEDKDLNNAEVIVFAHTFTERIPHLDPEIALCNKFDTNPKTEIGKAVQLYYKYLENAPYAEWAEEKWFEEINKKYSSRFKTVHLHVTHKSWEIRNLLGGMQVYPNLTALSLDEVGVDDISFDDKRDNHFSNQNNLILAKQLSSLITDYTETERTLDVDQFGLKTKKWIGKDLF